MSSLWHFVAAVMTHDAPTPQPSRDDDGAWSVTWIVDRWQVDAIWLLDGSWTIFLTDPDDRQEAHWDGRPGDPVPAEAVTAVRERLRLMGARVRRRVMARKLDNA